jgi:3',5'-cyclic-AMP phosphodiesterase
MWHRRAASRLEVFAVEDRAVQVCWGTLGPGVHRLSAGAAETKVDADGGPGAVVLDGLEPDTTYELVVQDVHGGAVGRLPFRTLAPPPGNELCRIATISDLHIGSTGFGALPVIRETGADEPHALRCARAAIREALAWGAQLLVVKGDLADQSYRTNWDAIGELLARLPVPVDVIPGNHDVGRRRTIEPEEGLAPYGIPVTRGLQLRDLPGLRLVSLNTTIPGRSDGRVRHLQDEVCRLLRRAPGGALIAVHHLPQRFRIPTAWPPGIPGPEARRFLDGVAEANPRSLVTAGHTHRNRRTTHGPLVVTSVGSTSDYPGTWAGYAVHEGGIRQVVRRIAAPDSIRWTERTRRTLGGAWQHISPGTLGDRCFSHAWAD